MNLLYRIKKGVARLEWIVSLLITIKQRLANVSEAIEIKFSEFKTVDSHWMLFCAKQVILAAPKEHS